MLKMNLAAGLAAAALMSGAAFAQTTTAPATQNAGAGQVMTSMPMDQFRASRLMGVDVYGTDNAKIGDIDEILVDKMGKIHAVVVGVGGFLGIGQKDVAIPFEQVEWKTSREVQAMNNANVPATTTAGSVTAPAAPTTNTNPPPATTGSTGMNSGAAGMSSPAADDTTPTRAMVKMTKADLQNAPEFNYSTAAR